MSSSDGSLDTNILLRFLLVDEPEQFRKVQKLIGAPRLYRVSLLAIAEAVFIMEGKGFTRAAVLDNIEALSSVRNLKMSREVILAATALYVKQPALSFVDACLAFEAETTQAEPLWTFDKKLAKQAPHTKLIEA